MLESDKHKNFRLVIINIIFLAVFSYAYGNNNRSKKEWKKRILLFFGLT